MPILVDAHIHIHSAGDLDCLLDSAWGNFSAQCEKRFQNCHNASFVLLLAEGKKNEFFSLLHKQSVDDRVDNTAKWYFKATEEHESLIAINGEKHLVLIAGRQIISKEKLEVLSLFSRQVFPDNTHSLAILTEHVTEAGGIPLLTWGVGKWLGKRGEIIKEFLDNPSVRTFFVGDNGNRPALWPYPKLLVQAEHMGVMSLAGSDPLPLAGHGQRAGSFGSGFDTAEALSETQPAKELKRILASNPKNTPFGQGVGPLQFFRDQVIVNLKKRIG